jgi:hypothetical protein
MIWIITGAQRCSIQDRMAEVLEITIVKFETQSGGTGYHYHSKNVFMKVLKWVDAEANAGSNGTADTRREVRRCSRMSFEHPVSGPGQDLAQFRWQNKQLIPSVPFKFILLAYQYSARVK